MLITLMVPRIRPPSASVAPRIKASNVSSHNMGIQRRCVSQKSRAIMADVPTTEPLISFCMLSAISLTNTGRPV